MNLLNPGLLRVNLMYIYKNKDKSRIKFGAVRFDLKDIDLYNLIIWFNG